MTAERKYTDRDVRENPSLRELAENYLCDYGGDFEPLVDAQFALMNLPFGEQLPTNTVRVVLNCMRHDNNVASSLPEPVRPKLELVTMPRRNRKYKFWLDCDNTESHEPHSWGEDTDRHRCSGVPFEINREYTIVLDAKVKLPYVRAGQSQLIHMTTGEAWSYWQIADPIRVFDDLRAATHKYGPRFPSDLHVKTVCKYPSIIKNGTLLDGDEVSELLKKNIFNIHLCPHCVKATMTE